MDTIGGRRLGVGTLVTLLRIFSGIRAEDCNLQEELQFPCIIAESNYQPPLVMSVFCFFEPFTTYCFITGIELLLSSTVTQFCMLVVVVLICCRPCFMIDIERYFFILMKMIVT